MILLKILGVWLLCEMVYWINPLNDPNNPESIRNYYHPENISARHTITKLHEQDSRQLILNWNEMLPYLSSGATTFLCIAIDIAFTV